MPELPEWYWRTLERAYEFFLQQGRPQLLRGHPPVQIYLFAVDDGALGCGDPRMSEFLFEQPSRKERQRYRIGIVLALPARSNEPAWEAELGQALSTAVHELSHALNAQVLPYRRLGPNGQERRKSAELARCIASWLWLDEGIAEAAEAAFAANQLLRKKNGEQDTLPLNHDWLRFALDWVDRPERSLDDFDAVYQAGFFVRYLHRRMNGPHFVNDVWQKSARVWDHHLTSDCSALSALAEACKELNPSEEFCSATAPDIFASGYCFDSYFLNDPKSKAYEPEVYGRFRERAVTRTWRMGMVKEWPDGKAEKYTLLGLACRYFRLIPPEETRRLLVRVLPPPGKTVESIKSFKAEIAFAFAQPGPDNGYCQQGPKGITVRQTLFGNGELTCEIPSFSTEACDHAVLVVTNCDYSRSTSNQLPPTGYMQSADFCVEARLI